MTNSNSPPPPVNLPWTESPFFEEELKKRGSLSPEQQKLARFYHDNGYVILRGKINESLVAQALADLDGFKETFSFEQPRAAGLWKKSSPLRSIATFPPILDLLKMLYDREPIPFQTLNFKYGSRQKPHSDSIHFDSLPHRFMCAAWVALEDMDEDNGPVVYYPSSHTLPTYDYHDISKEFRPGTNLPWAFYRESYEPFLQALIKKNNFKPQVLTIKKGDVLIWSSNILHGGMPIKDENRTRWSQVTHYYFEDCLYYTPQWSNKITGEWFLREITNIKTGKKTWGSYNGHVVKRKAALHYRYIISPVVKKGWRDLQFLFTRLYDRYLK